MDPDIILQILIMPASEISNNASLSVNVMMQQGMQALSKVLKGPLRDHKRPSVDQTTLQALFGRAAERKNLKELPKADDVVSIDEEFSASQSIVETNHESLADFDDPELHLDGEDGEIIFDCGTQELMGSPDQIGEHITQMLESVLPNGMQTGPDGRLHAVVNGDELNITEESFIDLQEAMTSLGHLQTAKQRQQNVKRNLEQLRIIDEHDDDKCMDDEPEAGLPSEESSQQYEPSTKMNNHKHLDFEYPTSHTKRTPNFTALIDQKSPLCLFCEYYMVFGEPPRNMIKWYNKMYEYDSIPRASDKQEQQHQHQHQKNRRKRNR